MHRGDQIPLIREDAPMSEALVEITAKRLGCVGVTDKDGRLVGVITDGDLRRHMSPDLLQQKAGIVMTAKPLTIRQGALAAEALGTMNSRGITNIFVVDETSSQPTRPVGVLHIHDVLRAGVA